LLETLIHFGPQNLEMNGNNLFNLITLIFFTYQTHFPNDDKEKIYQKI